MRDNIMGNYMSMMKRFEINTEDAVIVETDGENIGLPPVKYTILPQTLKVII